MCVVHMDLLGGKGGHGAHDLAHQVLSPHPSFDTYMKR